MQEFQKNMQTLRVINSFAKGTSKGESQIFDGDYMGVNIQKENKLLGQFNLMSYYKFL